DGIRDGHVTGVQTCALPIFALRGRLRASNARSLLDEVLDQIRASGYLALSAMSAHAWDLFLDLDIPELHDRMIAADALSRSLPTVTNDPPFSSVPGLRTVWGK